MSAKACLLPPNRRREGVDEPLPEGERLLVDLRRVADPLPSKTEFVRARA